MRAHVSGIVEKGLNRIDFDGTGIRRYCLSSLYCISVRIMHTQYQSFARTQRVTRVLCGFDYNGRRLNNQSQNRIRSYVCVCHVPNVFGNDVGGGVHGTAVTAVAVGTHTHTYTIMNLLYRGCDVRQVFAGAYNRYGACKSVEKKRDAETLR